MSKDAGELLTQWGRWVHQGTGVPRYVSPMLALMRDHVASSHSLPAAITDDDAMLISGIMARMKGSKPTTCACMHLYYMYNLTMDQVGKIIILPRRRVRELVMAGQDYVQGALDNRLEGRSSSMDAASVQMLLEWCEAG